MKQYHVLTNLVLTYTVSFWRTCKNINCFSCSGNDKDHNKWHHDSLHVKLEPASYNLLSHSTSITWKVTRITRMMLNCSYLNSNSTTTQKDNVGNVLSLFSTFLIQRVRNQDFWHLLWQFIDNGRRVFCFLCIIQSFSFQKQTVVLQWVCPWYISTQFGAFNNDSTSMFCCIPVWDNITNKIGLLVARWHALVDYSINRVYIVDTESKWNSYLLKHCQIGHCSLSNQRKWNWMVKYKWIVQKHQFWSISSNIQWGRCSKDNWSSKPSYIWGGWPQLHATNLV